MQDTSRDSSESRELFRAIKTLFEIFKENLVAVTEGHSRNLVILALHLPQVKLANYALRHRKLCCLGQIIRAEGMGLEPTTGCPAPEFQS